MSTLNNKVTLSASGLSRQSEKTYKALRKKSNADLNKTLKQINTEHQASISKILSEEYALKNVHHALKTAGLFVKKQKLQPEHVPMELANNEGDISGDISGDMSASGDIEMVNESEMLDLNANTCEFIEKEEEIPETKPEKIKPHTSESYTCHLPIIIEETTRRVSRSKFPTTRGSNYTLPPLTRVDSITTKMTRSTDDRSPGHLTSTNRSRNIRTQSIPVETTKNAVVDNYSRYGVSTKRKSYMNPIGHRRNSIDGSRLRHDSRSKDDDSTNKPVEAWGGGMVHCRYLRRSASSPSVLNPENVFNS